MAAYQKIQNIFWKHISVLTCVFSSYKKYFFCQYPLLVSKVCRNQPEVASSSAESGHHKQNVEQIINPQYKRTYNSSNDLSVNFQDIRLTNYWFPRRFRALLGKMNKFRAGKDRPCFKLYLTAHYSDFEFEKRMFYSEVSSFNTS